MGSWWIDEAPYPGPVSEPTFNELFEALAVVGRSFGADVAALFAPSHSFHIHRARGWGGTRPILSIADEWAPMIEEFNRSIKPIIEIQENFNKIQEDRRKVRNNGPRPRTTFGKNGQRRY